MRLFDLSLGDVINLNRLAMQAADMSTSTEVKIGASVMTVNGNMYQGANLEYASSPYGTGLTAEDCALFKALSEGQKIAFDVEPDKKGKGPKAVNIRVE